MDACPQPHLHIQAMMENTFSPLSRQSDSDIPTLLLRQQPLSTQVCELG